MNYDNISGGGQKLIDDGYVGGGMIPKLKNCIDAIEEGVIGFSSVAIRVDRMELSPL